MKSPKIIHLFCMILCNQFQLLVNGSNGDLEAKLQAILEGVYVGREGYGSVPIDEDHLRRNPECGYLPAKTGNVPPSSRIANAKEADQHYPWMILLRKTNRHINNGDIDLCGGAIITQTIAVTAAHCICGSPDYRKIPPHLRQYTECIGGDHTKFNPPNEIRHRRKGHINFNEMTANFGDKDKIQTTPIDILIAYVMADTRNDPSIKETLMGTSYDVGLVITTDEFGNGDQFYQHTNPNGNIKVGSVCLAAKKDNEPFMYEGNIVSVGWGRRYSDVKFPNGKPKPNLHSCTTNRFGPSSATFRYCNLDYILSNPNDKKCQRQDKPKGYDSVKCNKYLEQAEKAVEKFVSKIPDDSLRERMSLIWKLTNKIEISATLEGSCIGPLTGSKSICYKQKLFDDYGWCYLDVGNGNVNTNEWGFCDTSCDLVSTANTKPQIYHEMVWQFPTEFPFSCDSSPHDPDEFKPWYICIVYKPPQTSVFKFKKARFNKLKFCEPDKYDPIKRGYQLPCKGDSGSGHFMRNSDERKWALVAINAYARQHCGADAHAITTVHPDVLNWIKYHSKIVSYYESEIV